MSFNLWQPQGTVIASEGSVFYPFLPNVIYENNAQILSGTVFKMWYIGKSAGLSALKYAESTDGLTWTQYSGNPVLADVTFAKIYKNNSIYYCFCNPSSFEGTGISVYTSSDGLVWTLAMANAILPSGSGWDANFVCQLAVCDIVNGTWYAYYTGQATDGSYGMGLATSVDGLTWVKSPSNPIPSMKSGTLQDGSSWLGSGDFCFRKVNGIYYGWSQTTATSDPGATTNLPSDIMRWSSTSPAGPWTALGSLTYYRNATADGIGNAAGQAADPCIVEANGSCYLYYSAVIDQTSSNANTIGCAIANVALSELVQTFEGVQDIPIPHSLSLNTSQLLTDNFQRANANPIGAPWVNVFSNGTTVSSQIVSDKLEGTALSTGSDIVNTSVSLPADQYAQVVPSALGAVGSAAEILLRVTNQNTTTPTYLRILVRNETSGTNGFLLQVVTAGSFATTFKNYTPTVGHTYTACVAGTTLSIYDNQSLIFVFTSVTPSSGDAGCGVEPIAALTDASLSFWSAGNLQSAPSPPAVIKNSWVQIQRDFVNKHGLR